MNLFLKTIIYACFLVFIITYNVKSNNIIKINDTQISRNIKIEYHSNLVDLYNNPFKLHLFNFNRLDSSEFSNSFSKKFYLFRLIIDSLDEDYSKKEFVVFSKNIFLDHFDLFYKNKLHEELGLKHITSGEWSLPTFNLNHLTTKDTFYIKTQSDCISKIDLSLNTLTEYIAIESKKNILYFVISFILFTYSLIALGLFFKSKKPGFLFMSLYSFFSVLFALFMNGYAFQLFPNMNIIVKQWSFAYFIDIYTFLALAFSYSVLDISKRSLVLKKIYYLCFIIIIILALSPLFLSRDLVTKGHFFISGIFIFYNSFVGFYLFFTKKLKIAILLGIGWLVYYCFSIIWSLGQMGFFPQNFFTDHAPGFGMLVEFLVFGVLGGLYYFDKSEINKDLYNKFEKLEDKKKFIIENLLPTFNTLSEREKEVLELISKGLLDKEIVEKLKISLPTVRTYCSRIFTKLNVENRTEASNLYNQIKIIEDL